MEQQYLTVTALTKYLKRKFDADPYLERVYLTGEISNFRLRPNAHQYFSLKDDGAKISAIMFKSAFQKLKFQPKEGMKVLLVGRISLYESGGSYQIYVEHMEPDGVGALYQALAELREKLGKEGLFEGPKKRLPRYPKRIAVVTSPSGAVIRDIITTVKRRYPIAQLVLFPTLVQGDQAADDIVRNIQRIEELGTFDTMIIGRGGGSIEDLWPFNEEQVARAIYQANTPVISSVGHETDVTIADMVADVRAATPTAAAELAVPVLNEELLKVKDRQTRLEQSFLYQLQQKNERYQRLRNSYVFKQPDRLYEGQTIKLDRITQRLIQSMETVYHQKQRTAQEIIAQFRQQTPQGQIREGQQQLKYLNQSLHDRMEQYMKDKEKQFTSAVQQLDLLSPLKIMGRGYSYTTKEQQVIKSVNELQPKEKIQIHYVDGIVDTVIEKITPAEEE
ncbi:exodeoxyribonuclease 7 large subunit [Enterococcus haemoperoxidus ATCC BAA-382]|uniref:Exodeoxyribonuclease 7 large subunit n=1 Tax=Enterococcus haemoperoxidus ATCC BAA-382 TaxID=1158608 RepID=R2SD55_9ENTE|nr:exodeoxyribonuclease VII large subunit [Enterococcus haemoperoxidus]EOH93435.1 exodeoxyribonuclease 7 large subunit [Enterococcus haemoperoxidus ATCC BAA-382]EOT61389.1 exodeoxyribonuclease 7 large subunit [Enterococcus haemoperoxidus ATCC BAA-382]OJG51670.1 exodeoxyribonuclease 7 large subunit [Enterococcus haemoperoxidus]